MLYPLYDRSGVDDDDYAIAMARRAKEAKKRATPNCEIHICDMCSGGDAVLAEIEELVKQVDGKCAVRPSGCLGYCNVGPNAVLVERGSRRLDPLNVHTRILSLEKSAMVVEHATGVLPALEGDGTKGRLAELRAARSRQHAVAVSKWNAALHGLPERAAKQKVLRSELRELLRKAGFPQGLPSAGEAPMPSAIANYSPWSIESVTPVTKHSAIFRFKSADLKRGTPHPRGRGRLPQPMTWHTTLLAEVGPNAEGPLPWVERDYTPVSSAKEWEQGHCDILIKVYASGTATSWLHQATPTRVWLSKPERTLAVPDLVPEGRASFRPASVLLLLAGTGIVALPQILAHRDPTRLAISTPYHSQLRVPIDLIYSCREDDVPLLPQIVQWCREGHESAGREGVRSCNLLLTPSTSTQAPPFPVAPAGDAAEAETLLAGLGNVSMVRGRLSSEVVSEVFKRMPQPCRVVVSGPSAFNAAARGMLADLDVEEQVTILPA